MKKLLLILFCGIALNAFAGWKTHFAYTNVTQIAVNNEVAYGLSDGVLFSVNKQTERLTEWTKQNGMHGSGIWQIGYDEVSDQLLVLYSTGRIDLIKGKQVTYLSDFYNKDMTASKRTNNITFHHGRAYLSMEFGIVSFDMRRTEFVDTYYIGEDASEVNVEDVVLLGDSIYAFTDDTLYSANTKDNIVDFRCWKYEPLTDRIPRDTDKGKRYTDSKGDVWTAGGTDGIVRKTITGEQMSYKPDGPQNNIPYRLSCGADGKLYMLSGGRWATQFNRPGHVMVLDDGHWSNITQSAIKAQTKQPVLDMMNVAVDPQDMDHYFVTSFGTGLYEFRGTTLLNHFTPENSSLCTANESHPELYTRCDHALFDANGNLLMIATGPAGPTLAVKTPEGDWGGVNLLLNGVMFRTKTPAALIIDSRNPNIKWVVSGRETTGVFRLDDGGTVMDPSDDKYFYRNEWWDQQMRQIRPSEIYVAKQDADGNIWMGTEKGIVILPASEDFLTSESCRTLPILTNIGDVLMEDDAINDICFDDSGNVWCATNGHGIYVLTPDGGEVKAHYTSANTIMPADVILALAYNKVNNRMYVGTGQGLVSYSDSETDITTDDSDMDEPDYGVMHGWSLHPAYSNVSAVTASATDIYALSDGALFSVSRSDETIEYYNRMTGLSASNIRFITYNTTVNKLLVVYQNGIMDVLTPKGQTAILDLYLKGENKELTVNNITNYNEFVYFAMSFGIVVLDLKKGEIADTYYIGNNATDVNVRSVAVYGDSIYAAAEDMLYVGALKDNLIDFAHWKRSNLPAGEVPILTVCDGTLYLLVDNQLLRREGRRWRVVSQEEFLWIRESGTKLLAETAANVLVEVAKDGTITPLTADYVAQDALYSNGEYWLAAGTNGLIRYKDASYSTFQPNGPLSNLSYKLQFYGDKLMMAQGGRWAVQYERKGDVIYYDYANKLWHSIDAEQIISEIQTIYLDVMDYAVDPANPNHFFSTSYGCGVVEFLDDHAIHVYNHRNSTLCSASSHDVYATYVRTSGALIDRFGNLWVLNTGSQASAFNILAPDGQWHTLDLMLNGVKTKLSTSGDLIQDPKYPNSKWLLDYRGSQGVILIDDGGTPFDPSDDVMVKRLEFVDQLGATITPAFFYALATDHNGALWVGTEAGPFVIESANAFIQSNKCIRPIIYRNDGTNLVDYLLHAEIINAICIDGGNRKWIGTANSGVFLMSEDGTETIYHFTSKNSPLPSDEVLSIAIHPTTGEVFFGTSAGLASFRSDAAEPAENFDGIYAYPNPVRPNYEGVITITGLMDNTVVYIIDAAGNLVCKTRSNGAIAIWDGKNLQGKRVATGVYTVLCNTADGENHTVTKILVTH